jgi:hypothetical protein
VGTEADTDNGDDSIAHTKRRDAWSDSLHHASQFRAEDTFARPAHAQCKTSERHEHRRWHA